MPTFLLLIGKMNINLSKIEELVREVVEEYGVELYHMEFIEGGRNNFLRVYIDKNGGISVKDCEMVSKELSVLLDVEDPIPFRYVLEVSSPGIERRLYTVEHYRKNLGKEVDIKLKLKHKEVGLKRFLGIIRDVDEKKFKVEIKDERIIEVPYEDVEFVKIKFRFR